MIEPKLLFWIVLILICIAFARAGLAWARDLKFYKGNSWNFEEDSGETLHFGVETLRGKKLTNRQRVRIGFPFFLVGCMTLIAAILFELLN